MAQHDFNIANQGFPATRSDINNALAALASTSSGTSEPSTTYANQFWYDTTNNLLKFRNEADSAWITLAYLDQATNEWEIRSAVIQAVDSAGISLKTDDGTARVVIQDDGDVAFDTNTLFVDAANNRVGIGTSSPSEKLDLNTGGSSNTMARFTSDGSYYTHILSSNVTSVLSSDTSGNNAFQIRGGSNQLEFITSGVERMRVLSGGGLTFNGDTAAANALDDYEEGTWTPTLDYSSPGTSSKTYSTRAASYTKIGNLVTVSVQIRLTAFSKGTGSGELQITGLPFTVSNGTGDETFFGSVGLYDTPFSNIPVCFAAGNSTLIRFQQISGGGIWTAMSDPDANSQYFVTLTYRAA